MFLLFKKQLHNALFCELVVLYSVKLNLMLESMIKNRDQQNVNPEKNDPIFKEHEQ
jgi:hypothetical protein